MPAYNGTGPMGQGKMTGRKMGKCDGAVSAAGSFSGGQGMGRGMGRGRGFGCNRSIITQADEKTSLENQIDVMKKRLDEINKDNA